MLAKTIITCDPLALLEKLADQTPVYPAELLAARRIAFLRQMEAQQADSDGLWLCDPRTAEQVDRDEWEADTRATRESDRPL